MENCTASPSDNMPNSAAPRDIRLVVCRSLISWLHLRPPGKIAHVGRRPASPFVLFSGCKLRLANRSCYRSVPQRLTRCPLGRGPHRSPNLESFIAGALAPATLPPFDPCGNSKGKRCLAPDSRRLPRLACIRDIYAALILPIEFATRQSSLSCRDLLVSQPLPHATRALA